jgi:acyl dehydratase
VTRRFEEVSVGDAVPELRRVVTAADVKAYAEVGDDRNALHLDAAIARERGFDGVIAHGMFTMAHLATCVVEWTGEAGAITAISAQFRAPVAMGQEIVAGGRVRSLDPVAHTATLELWVTSERDGSLEWPIKRGEATVRLS